MAGRRRGLGVNWLEEKKEKKKEETVVKETRVSLRRHPTGNATAATVRSESGLSRRA